MAREAVVAEAIGGLRREDEATTVELVVVETSGDAHLERPIGEFGGQGVFVKEVERALLDGRADLAVHSAKDLPSVTSSEELAVVAVPKRADPRDALVGLCLNDLGPGARVATGAPRRRAQLAWLRPDLRFEELRGNIATRLAKIPPDGAVVVAFAALQRLGLVELAVEVLSVSTMVPQVGQGALAIQCRLADESTADLLAAIDDPVSHRCLDAERAFLAELGGGCELPVGAHAVVNDDGLVEIEGFIASPDGLVVLRRAENGEDAFAVGGSLAREILDRCGGAEILAGSTEVA